MPSPFPGMDPYLEEPAGWPTVHFWVIAGLAEVLGPLLPEDYWVAVERRTYVTHVDELALVVRPDAVVVDAARTRQPGRGGTATLKRGCEVLVPMPETVREAYLEIRERGEPDRVVTRIEVLSPTNKRSGVEREEYLGKRDAVLGSLTNLIEIDLLRGGQRMPVFEAPEEGDYRILVSRARSRPRAQLIPFMLRDPAPSFPVPLRSGIDEIELDLGTILLGAYERGQFARSVNYDATPEPPLSPEDEAWARRALLKGHPGRRG